MGQTPTQLAAENRNVCPSRVLLPPFLDIQVVSFWASATVNVYWNGVNVISFSGDVNTATGLSNFDSIFLAYSAAVGARQWEVSEVVVADEDLRAFPGLVTLALTGNGTTPRMDQRLQQQHKPHDYFGSTPYYTDTAAQANQFNITDLPAGSFVVKAVMVAARIAKSAGSTATQVKLGYNNGGATGFGELVNEIPDHGLCDLRATGFRRSHQ